MSRTRFSVGARPRRGYRPQVDVLEDRLTPSSGLGVSPPMLVDCRDVPAEAARRADDIALGVGLSANQQAAIVTTSPVLEFANRNVVRGESTLRRTDHGITIHLRASDVPAGAYSGWIAIFSPGVTGPVAAGRVAGHVVGEGGNLNFSVHLNEGETISGHPVFPSGSLQDAQRQEIHMVVRYHGPADPGRIHEQTHTFEPTRAFNFLITIHPAP